MYDLSTFMINVAVLSVELGPVGLAVVFRVCILPVFLNYGHFTLFVIVLLCFLVCICSWFFEFGCPK